MLPNHSHSHARPTLAYHAPASRPTTTELVTLQSGIDNLGVKLSRTPLVNCDTRNLREIAIDIDKALDLVTAISDRLGAEIANRRRDTTPAYQITTVGILLLDPRPVVSPEERVRIAEKEARDERALAFSFNPNVDSAPVPHEHPANCGCAGCINRAIREGQDRLHSGKWGLGDERRGA